MKKEALVLQNAEGEGPGLLAGILLRRKWRVRKVRLYAGEMIPKDWENYGVLAVMGGPMNAYEEDVYPFLAEETEIIREALREGQPVIGFCLGAQLMAKAKGAKVVKGPVKEIGWHSVRLTPQGAKDGLLKSFPERMIVFQWHGDTFFLPDGAERLFTSSHYMNQAMRIGTLSYGFQFHFEITRDMIETWLMNGQGEIREMKEKDFTRKIKEGSRKFLYPMQLLGQSFLQNYIQKLEKGLQASLS